MRGRIGIVVALAIGAVVVAAPSPVSAAIERTVSDPDDVAGRLDLAGLRYTKSSGRAPMVVTIRTHTRWRTRVLRGNVNRLSVQLDVDRDGTRDFTARIRKVPEGLFVFIAGSGETFEPLRARRPDRRTVRFTIPGDTPPNPRGRVDMRASSRFIESHACDPASGSPACVDRVPDAGWL